jgi:hypothetical protein
MAAKQARYHALGLIVNKHIKFRKFPDTYNAFFQQNSSGPSLSQQ